MMRVAIVLESRCTVDGLRVGATKATTLVDTTYSDKDIEMLVRLATAVGGRRGGDAWNCNISVGVLY